MENEKQKQNKPSGIAIFFDELSKSSGLVTFLAILTGILISGLLVALTTVEVYDAFSVSFWGGIKEALSTAWNTYSSLFIGAFGDPQKIIAAFKAVMDWKYAERSIHSLKAWFKPHLSFLAVSQWHWVFELGFSTSVLKGSSLSVP